LKPDLSAYTAGKTFEGSFRQCFDPAAENCPEWDLEALARDGNRLFATGSMGFKRKKIKFDPDRWAVTEVAISNVGQPRRGYARVQAKIRRLARLFQGHSPDIASAPDRPLQCGGLNIEGLAFSNGKLFFGLRSPSVRNEGSAFVVSAKDDEIFANSGPLRAKLHKLAFKNSDGTPVRHLGIRALEPIGSQMLIVTGAAGVRAARSGSKRRRAEQLCREASGAYDNLPASETVPAALWLWRPGEKRVRLVGIIGDDYADRKLEGVAVIALRGNRADLLLAFDDPDDLSALAVLKNITLPD
ncbi:MAG TPA: hypothetical protein DCE33_02145, partial [Rhodospirillaceae bacterium]|nr:hypothetical protein [Rhodospirillaceae bacterium]